jgi:hypothetical protein
VAAIDERTSAPQLFQKPTPFVLQLTIGGENALDGDFAAKLGVIELVAARQCLCPNHGEVMIDGGARSRAQPEPLQLRMPPVALGMTAKDFAREQRFSPKRDETLRIEILGVKRPQSHEIAAA